MTSTPTTTRPAPAAPSRLRADTDWLAASRVTFAEAGGLSAKGMRQLLRLVGRLLLSLLRTFVAMLWCAWYTPALLRALTVWRHVMTRAGIGQIKVMPMAGWEPYPQEKPRRAPRRWGAVLTPTGYRLKLRLRHGQTYEDVVKAIPALSSSLRGNVRVSRHRRRTHLVYVWVQKRDPFRRVRKPVALSATRLRVGVLETGRPFVLDLRERPHWLLVGATGSGKTRGLAAILAALAPTDAVVCVIDLKWGVAAASYAERASVVAESQDQAVDVLGDLLALGAARAEVCKTVGVDSVYDLDRDARPPEVVCVIDEIAELAIPQEGTRDAKALAADGMSKLLRCVQLLRSFGIHVIVAGQRFSVSIAPRATDIRAQLSGRVCLRVEDAETADMAVGDLTDDREPVAAALRLPVEQPGCGVASGGLDGWQRIRLAHVSHAKLATVAAANLERRTPWDRIVSETAGVQIPADAGDLEEGQNR
ncbi:hypothetical protein MU582_12005 [Nocardioidaceae bacterium SCSIO 66511]|nr:hypothetical protein MU582_12005 [Nocardioidaceae bacterium SCSIO 66511]